jgi:hypothetical protein
MADIGHVFAAFTAITPPPQEKRELLNIPRKRMSHGSCTVKVVHVRSGVSPKNQINVRGHRASVLPLI